MTAAGGEAHRTATMLVSCRDQQGIVAAVSGLLAKRGANIVHAEQHIDRQADVFFQRVEFEVDTLAVGLDQLAAEFTPLVEQFSLELDLRSSATSPRVAILCSKQGHCLYDLLARWRLGEMPGELALVASNHGTHRAVVEDAGIEFHHLPVDPDDRPTQQQALLDLLTTSDIGLVVMARYMQILPASIVDAFPSQIINIHHSFLPAFPGGRPYHQAHARGVKLVGVTAHYATADLDEGPIIDQDVTRVSHRHSVEELVQRGRDLETVVLARGVRAHLENRILVYGNKTVVFG